MSQEQLVMQDAELEFDEELEVQEEEEVQEVAAEAEETISDELMAPELNKVMDATQLYLGEIGFSPLLTAEEEVYYARRALRGDKAARKRMIESNLRLVPSCMTMTRSLIPSTSGSSDEIMITAMPSLARKEISR